MAKRSKLEWLVRLSVFFGLVGFVGAMVVIAGVYVLYAPSVPQFDSIGDYQPKIGTRIYSADGQLMGEFAAERRVVVPYERVPERFFQAFIAAEDKRFFKHVGIDFLGVAKAVTDKLLRPDSKLRGASTITQQVAKSLLATKESYESATERSFARKIREAILARRLETGLSKEEILFLYVNQIFLGHKAYGIQAAAEHYFRKNVWELTLAEMATVAGLPQRPSDYSPISRPKAAMARRRYVLRRMEEEGFISEEERDAALAEEITVYPREEEYLRVAPFYTEQVRRELLARYGERTVLEEGLVVEAAVNLEAQARARRALNEGLHELDKRQGFRGALTRLPQEKRSLFRRLYREQLGLQDEQVFEFEPGKLYLAVVTGFASDKVATIDVAGQEGFIPLAGMRWARRPNPTERYDLHYIEDVRKAVREGDVIAVATTSKAQLAKNRHGWDILDTVPEEGAIFKLEQEPIAQAAVLSVEPHSGYVIAQVGGYDFADSTYNRAVQACREPGSAFKPIVYSAALDKLDYTASTMIEDKPLIFDDAENAVRWKPSNAGEEFRGELPLRTALKDSINTPAIRVAEAVGIGAIMKNAERLGLSTPLKKELGTALGSSCTTLYDLIQVYVTLNQYGQRRQVHFIRRVMDRFGNVIEDNASPQDAAISLGARLDAAYAKVTEPPRQALDAPTAFLTMSLLHNVVTGGTAIAASRLPYFVAGKTGTTNDSYDAWFMGMTRDLVTGVWVGHDKKERPLGVGETGGRTALPIWTKYVSRLLVDRTATPPKPIAQGPFPAPEGVVSVSIDPENGLLARPNTVRPVREYYRAGRAPTEYTPDAEELSPETLDLYGADTPL